MNIPKIADTTLVLPEYYAGPKANGRYRIVHPLTPLGNLRKIQGQYPIKIISRPVKHAVLLDGHSEPIALKLFSKSDTAKLRTHFGRLLAIP